MKKITDAEIDRWAKEQRRRYHAGLLEPWQVEALKKRDSLSVALRKGYPVGSNQSCC
jgi:hypothetical protein